MTERPKAFARRDLFGLVAGLAAVPLAAIRCREGAPSNAGAGTSRVTFPAAELAGGRRKIVMVGANPVEVRTGPSGPEARMLRCTHSGCIVRWMEEENAYVCPCHEGRYAADGRVASGPPPEPLHPVPIRLVSGELTVG